MDERTNERMNDHRCITFFDVECKKGNGNKRKFRKMSMIQILFAI